MPSLSANSLISGAVGLVLWLTTGLPALAAVAVALSVFALGRLISALGHRLAILEFIGAMAAVELLLIPVFTYVVFPQSMPLDATAYLRYVVPAVAALLLGLSVGNRSDSHADYVARARAYLHAHARLAPALLALGVLGTALAVVAPAGLRGPATLLASCLYVSVLYFFCSPGRYTLPALGLALGVMVAQAAREGMFGHLFVWAALWVLVLSAGVPVLQRGRVKTVVVMLALVGALLVQSVKYEYRFRTWSDTSGNSSSVGLMVALMTERLANPLRSLEPTALFGTLARFNQGLLLGYAMVHVPLQQPYAGGEVLWSLAYPFIPRVVWPNKPITGGRENIRRYTPVRLYEGNSVNISPVGEGYVNFGRWGGVLFMLGYGALFAASFRYVLRMARSRPALILWLPILFMGALTMETDLLTTWGTLVSSAVFLVVIWAGGRLVRLRFF